MKRTPYPERTVEQQRNFLRARMRRIRDLNPHTYESLQSYKLAASTLRRLES